jgi:hypothetical protein
LPSTDDFREALSPISDFLNDLRGALASVAPIIRVVLVEGLKILGAALKGLLVPFQLLAAFLEGLFGEGEKLKTSVGAAVRNASFQSAESPLRSRPTSLRSARGWAVGVRVPSRESARMSGQRPKR